MDRNEKKIVFAAGSVYPYASPTGGICLDIARAFSRSEKVKIISSLTEYPVTPGTEIEGMELAVFYNELYKMRFFFSQKETFWYQWGLTCVRAADRLNTLLFVPKNGWWYWKKVYTELKKDLNTGRVKAVITFSEPFEAHWAAMKLKQEGYSFRWIAFFADPLATPGNKRNLFVSLERMKEMEEEILKACDFFLVTPEMEERFSAQHGAYADKKKIFPYLIKNLVQPAVFGASDPILVYAGRFYRDIRDPEEMLQTIVAAQLPGLRFDLYTRGDCEAVVRRYQREYPAVICLRDMVQRDQLEKIYADAAILVNLENKAHGCKPSKQYEYISTGKPILSFYYGQPDPVLEKYPLALQLRVGDRTERTLRALRQFIRFVSGKTLPFEQIAQLYPDNVFEKVAGDLERLVLSEQ